MKNALLGLALAVVSLPAAAQVPIILTSTQPYAPLQGATNLTLVARGGIFPATDEGFATIPLGFTFPFMGQNYTTVMADSNGFVMLGAGCTANCLSPAAFPSSAVPNGLIAGLWADMDQGAGQLRYVLGPGEVTIEWVAFEPYFTNLSQVTFQVSLNASGRVTIHHGPMVGTDLHGSVGFEDAPGALGANLLSGCTNSCSTTNWVPNQLFSIGEPNDADLGFTQVTIGNLQVLGNGNWTFDLQGTLRNYGRTDADGFLWRAFLSTDRQLDANDQLVAQGGPVSMPITSTLAINSPAATTTAPPTGAYYVLMQADPTNVVNEASETNNVGATADQYVSGTDLVAASISGVTSSGGGNVDGLHVNFYNRGTVAAGVVTFKVLLSTDTTLDAADFPVATLTRPVSGGQTIDETIPVTMPANVPNGDFYYVLQVDPANAVVEASEVNNVVLSSGTVNVRRAELIVEAVELYDTVTNAPTRGARFGEAVRASITMSNTGGANATNFRLGLALSADANLSLLSDILVCEVVVPSLPAGTMHQKFTLDCTLPLDGTDHLALPTGQYFLFGVADSRGDIYEGLETNNNLVVGPVRITAPGADLTVTNVTAPAAAGVGEVIPVVRTLRNAGNVDAPAASYRYYASANAIITTDDIPLSILASPSGPASAGGSVTLAHEAVDTTTELLRLPGTMPAGTWYIGCVIDPEAQLADLDRANNGLASRPVQVAGSALRISSTLLPDATVGRPYLFRLAAAGQEGASTWSLTGAPAWLSLGATDGLLSGMPAASGAEVSGFTVTLTNSGRTSVARLVLRTLPPSTQIEITTVALPAVVNSSSSTFSYALGAAGGVRPYQWRLVAGSLPSGLAFTADGVLSGAPRGTPNGTTKFTVEVRDASGGRAQRELFVRLVAPGAIVIGKLVMPDGLVGAAYLEDIAVANADGAGLVKPLTWRLGGLLPDGLTLVAQSEIATISGRPARAGGFPFSITVEDANGRSDSMDYLLVVHGARYQVTAPLPEILRPSQADVSVQFAVTPVSQAVTFAVVAGVLPPGLSLTPAGQLRGAVGEDALGQWNFTVEAKDGAGLSGLGAFSLRVEQEPVAQGCAATGLASPLALLALGALARRRRGRTHT